jgi:hypothetical protein
LGPSTNIFGISTSGELLFLSDDTTLCPGPIGVCSVSQTTFTTRIITSSIEPSLKEIANITALAGLSNSPEQGIFAVSGNCGDHGSPCKVYNLYIDSGWKALEITSFPSDCRNARTRMLCSTLPDDNTHAHVYFGSYNGKVFVLEGMAGTTSHIYELTFEGGQDRYRFDEIASGRWDRRSRGLLCQCGIGW